MKKNYKSCSMKFQRIARFFHWYRCLVITMGLICTMHFAYSQVTIDGPTCVSAGVQYEYIISGSNWGSNTYMSWCLTGGIIAGTTNSCKSGTPVVYVYVIWNSGISSGTVSLNTSIGDAPNLQVNIVPALQSGTISSSTQSINYNTIPSASIALRQAEEAALLLIAINGNHPLTEPIIVI